MGTTNLNLQFYDAASQYRYNYARANPANFVDPSERSANTENLLILSLNSVAESTAVTALGYEVRCALYAEASAVHLVDEHMDQDITQLGLLMNQCAAQITVSQFGGWRTQSFSILNQPTNLGAPSFRVLCSVS